MYALQLNQVAWFIVSRMTSNSRTEILHALNPTQELLSLLKTR